MPELPEVETVRRRVAEQVTRARIVGMRVVDEGVIRGIGARELTSLAVDGRISDVVRHGKQLFLVLEGGGAITVHLGMTGDLMVRARSAPSRFDRVVLELDNGEDLVFEDMRKFGAVGWTEGKDSFLSGHGLGPDAQLVSKKEFVSRVGRRKTAIKIVLLDQHVVAGIGNLYADEVLFQARIHPLRPAQELDEDELGRLWKAIRRVLRASVRVSTDFDSLPRSFLLRNRRAGETCPRRNGILESIRVTGRTTIYCPTCQWMPRNG